MAEWFGCPDIGALLKGDGSLPRETQPWDGLNVSQPGQYAGG